MKKLICILIVLIASLWLSYLSYGQSKPFTYLAPGTKITTPDGITTILTNGGYLTTDAVVTAYLHDMNYLDYSDSLIIELNRQIKDKKSEITALDSIKDEQNKKIKRREESIAGKDSLIHVLMKPVEIGGSFVKWEGFRVNLISSYAFTKENLLQPIIRALEYGISTTFGFDVLNKISLSLEPIYFIGSQFKIQAKIGLKLF